VVYANNIANEYMINENLDVDDSDIYYWKIETVAEEFKKKIHLIHKQYKDIKLYVLTGYPSPFEEHFPIPMSLRNVNIFSKETDVESILKEINSNFTTPLKLTTKDIDSLFDMDFLNYYESKLDPERSQLKKKISIALSNQPNSKKLFHDLVYEVTENKIELIKEY
jgi:hypothetical protein